MILQLTRLIAVLLATTVNMGNAYNSNQDSTAIGGVMIVKEQQGMNSSTTTVERRSLENIFQASNEDSIKNNGYVVDEVLVTAVAESGIAVAPSSSSESMIGLLVDSAPTPNQRRRRVNLSRPPRQQANPPIRKHQKQNRLRNQPLSRPVSRH